MTTHTVSTSDMIQANIYNKAFDFLVNSNFTNANDAELIALAKYMLDLGLASGTEILSHLGSAAKQTDSEAGWLLFRRFLGKFKKQAAKDLHFRIRAVERMQERGRLSDQEITIGEYESYTVMPWDQEPWTVADYYAAVEDLETSIATWNTAIVQLLGWSDDGGEEYSIPWAHIAVDTPANMDKAPEDREYTAIHNLSQALMEFDRQEEAKHKAKKDAAKSMLDALINQAA